MQIECIIKRVNGTRVTIDGETYHFAPPTDDPTGPHVADVRRKDHIAKFLSISEAYSFYSGPDDEDPEPAEPVVTPDPTTPATPEALAGYDAVQSVLANPVGVDDETVRTAFTHLEGREPHGRAKTVTVKRKVIEIAAANGLIAEGGDSELLAQLDD